MYFLEFIEVMKLVGKEVLNKENLLGKEKELWEKVNVKWEFFAWLSYNNSVILILNFKLVLLR